MKLRGKDTLVVVTGQSYPQLVSSASCRATHLKRSINLCKDQLAEIIQAEITWQKQCDKIFVVNLVKNVQHELCNQ
jgi:hypothetical protein